ncbi:unnamed protein product [Bursaphelenchus okinawaensis]|uniref:Secreted protein n=1 Tax=Bursaphelenchus okinawaensis TaxID=465554 RepID=A0A811LU45_9BILA|nr:unnamed protein product [Bursaphelenchus okinawaensis]CAG9128089.1 unnamed protein product [Bursaphelenchus okinawaensis]
MKQNIDLFVFVLGVSLAFLLVDRPDATEAKASQFVCIRVNNDRIMTSSQQYPSANVRCMLREEFVKLRRSRQATVGTAV